jgi:Tfp pilus assembly protein PilN
LEHNESSFQGATQQLESKDSHKELLEIEKKFQDVNKRVEVATKLNGEHFHFTQLLEKLDEVLPLGVTISSVSTKDYLVSLSGKAAERNDMVLLEKSLNGESCFTTIDIPPSVWLSPKDIAFQISFSVKKECMKQ